MVVTHAIDIANLAARHQWPVPVGELRREAEGPEDLAEDDRVPGLEEFHPPGAPAFYHMFGVGEFEVVVDDENNVNLGRPCVDGASVKAEIVQQGRGRKIIVFKMKRRKGYRKKQGHRQGFTEIRIERMARRFGA